MEITEPDLIIPALRLMNSSVNGHGTTTELIEKLTILFNLRVSPKQALVEVRTV